MYILTHFQCNRGTFNSQAAGEDRVSAQHSYKSADDTIAVILAPGYFPTNFGLEEGMVQVNDTISIVGTDGAIDGLITATTIVTISTVENNNVFPSGIFVDTIQPISAADTISLWTNSTAGVMTLGNAGVIVQTPGGIFSQGTITGNNGIATQTIDVVSGSADLGIAVGLNAGFNTVIGNANSLVEVPGGVLWTQGTAPGSITSYQQNSGNITFSGPWAAPKIIPYSIRMINDTVFFTCKFIDATSATNAVLITAPAGSIPAFAAPTSSAFKVLYVVDNSVATTGSFIILADGSISIAATVAGAVFSATGIAGTGTLEIIYDHSV